MQDVSGEPLPTAVLISGTGRSLLNLIERTRGGRLPAEIRLVVSSRPDAPGLNYAREAGIPTEVVEASRAGTANEFSASIFSAVRAAGARLAVLAGFIKYLPIPGDFENRAINIHPALIPAFCGKGYYGKRVHEAVLRYGVKVSGCTVHFVDNEYDHGPIILQRPVPVLDDDTPDTLAARVFAEELEALPEAIALFADGRLKVDGRRVRIERLHDE